MLDQGLSKPPNQFPGILKLWFPIQLRSQLGTIFVYISLSVCIVGSLIQMLNS